MSSISYGGSVLLKAEIEERSEYSMGLDEYPFAIPKVYLDGYGEEYYPQTLFSWADDSIVLIRDKKVVRCTHSKFVELLAKDEDGNIVWMDGRNAPYSGCWDGEYLDEHRNASEYTIEEYNLETKEKKKYKMVLMETSQMNSRDCFHLRGLVDDEDLPIEKKEAPQINYDDFTGFSF